MRRFSAILVVFVVVVISFLLSSSRADAATFRNRVAQEPAAPTSADSVRIWMESDTAFGETAGVEYHIVGTGTYVKVLGTFDTGGPSPANWRADIPAHSNGTQIEYQLFTRNEFGSDYGFMGFNWSYTVADGDIQWFGLRHDTFDSFYRSPFGAVPAGTPVTLRFRTFPFDVDGVQVRLYQYDPATQTTAGPTDYPMTYLEDRVEDGTTYAIWTATLATPVSPAILYYKFRITDGLDVDFYSDVYANNHDNLGQGGEGTASDDEPFPSFQITAYDPAFETPEWLQNANVYQIFPDRFYNGDSTNDYCSAGGTTGCPSFYDGSLPTVAHTTWNEAIYDPRQPGPYFNTYGSQFFGGDLQGIEAKLDYLQGLGIDTLYLTPIFKGRSNHRYDTDEYLEVDPALGGDAAFASLVEELERRGMHLILDGVFNHTSSDSLYFDRYHRYAGDGACETLGSAYRDWYEFNNDNVPCTTGDYQGWFGFDSLAVLQDDSMQVRDFFYRTTDTNVMEYWYDRGASGWRFDVADEISHNWWRDFRPYAKSYDSEGPLIGEIWYDASQFLTGDQLDAVMSYRFRKNVLGFARGSAGWNDNDNNGSNGVVALTPSQFDHALRAVREDYPPEATAAMLNLVDSHDTNRVLYVLTLLGDSGLTEAKERLKLTALFQFTYIGAPMVYYGDEAALDSPSLANGPNGPEDDPYNRAPYPWADESGDPDIYGPADGGMIAYYSQLAHLRQQHAALRTGSVETLLTGDTSAASGDDNMYAFARVGGGEAAIVALNNGAASNTATVPVGAYFADGATLQDALSGATYPVSGGNVTVTLAARSGAVLFPAPASTDTTPPMASTSASPVANSAGWNNSAVTVQLNGSDGESGVAELRYWVNAGPTTVTPGASASVVRGDEGTTIVNVRAVDNAGNISALAGREVRIDVTPPSVSVTGVEDGATYLPGAVPTAGCSTSDGLSGVEMEATVSVTGGSANGFGLFTATCEGASDMAGNGAAPVSVTYTVAYNFSGFFAPVDNLPTLNVVNSGRAIPVKFSLDGDQGLDIFEAGYPTSQQIACDYGEPIGIIEETVQAGSSSLSYDVSTDQYVYVWKTSRAWRDSCRQFTIILNDGSVHQANFRFTR
ncbi:MAG: alpha-amylase family glycosyl hydrolase [Ardenticatenaceae bacterium]